jgi:hypothetical protein
MDWKSWRKLNPGRRFFTEAMFSQVVARDFPKAYPHGALLALEDKPAPAAKEAADFLASSRVAALSLDRIHPYTQEIYLARTASVLLALHGSRLDEKRDANLIAEIRRRLSAL